MDINIGDPVTPAPEPVRLPRILGGELVVTGYPLAMVLAEKIITMLQRRDASTRWRDFADLYTLSHRCQTDGTHLNTSLTLVGAHRNVRLIPLLDALDGMAGPAQPRWAAWRRKQRMEQQIPEQFAEVLHHVTRFADPAISGSADNMAWDPARLSWTTQATDRTP
jgi:hypothetical protein